MDRDKILTACGWMADVELPLIAERIVNHCVDRIAELEAALKAEEETAVDLAENAEEDMKRIAELEAIVAAQGINLSKKSKCIAELEAKLVRVLEWHEVSCYDELPFVIDELREGETALNGEGK